MVLFAFIVALSAVALCIVLPPWNAPMLIAAVIAIELSPFLFLLNLVTLVAATMRLEYTRRRAAAVVLLINLILTSVPLVLLVRERGTVPNLGSMFALRHTSTVMRRDIPVVLGETATTIRAYLPDSWGPHPMIFAIYGGMWRHGSAQNDAVFNRKLAGLGYAVFALDYRHAPQHRFPTALEDIRAQMRLLRRTAAHYNADPQRIAIIGHSSGGQLALLAGLAGGREVKAVISYSGPIDLADSYARPPSPDPLNIRAILRDYIGSTPEAAPRTYDAASPLMNIGSNPAPVLLLYGSRDHVVEVGPAVKLERVLKQHHAEVSALYLPWAEHSFESVPLGLHGVIAWSAVTIFLHQHDPASQPSR
ncbi:MAG: alpha/beta hydrolase [Candidatus Eremiobacteraeota bacterium]|nr:alpha/beta hydrolase [Candidatus Eremiobacteraeota bacterium]